jgi:hypothetical protein
VDVTLEIWNEMFHVFQMIWFLAETKRAIIHIAEFVSQRLTSAAASIERPSPRPACSRPRCDRPALLPRSERRPGRGCRRDDGAPGRGAGRRVGRERPR